jgi:hypothetical protein
VTAEASSRGMRSAHRSSRCSNLLSSSFSMLLLLLLLSLSLSLSLSRYLLRAGVVGFWPPGEELRRRRRSRGERGTWAL